MKDQKERMVPVSFSRPAALVLLALAVLTGVIGCASPRNRAPARPASRLPPSP